MQQLVKMLRIRNYLKIVPKRHCNMPLLYRTLTSYDIRHQFLDYFIKSNDRQIIRSCSVVAFYNNSSAATGNPDTNQKSHRIKAVNFHKHNGRRGDSELLTVETDSHHHQPSFLDTFRNWPFSGNLKKVACQSSSSRLFGTHFADGNEPLKDFIDIEMKDVLENSTRETHPFIVHYLTCATLLESVHLEKATRLCTDRPIIVLSSTDDEIKARCCVPRIFVTDKFSAHLWLSTVSNALGTEISPSLPSERNIDEVCHMKPKKLSSIIFDERLEIAMHQASDFARTNM